VKPVAAEQLTEVISLCAARVDEARA